MDIIIVGGGPIGIACGIEAHRRGLSYLIIEKGCLVNSIFHFPVSMTFFSTADLIEIGDVPFIISGDKPSRLDALKYYQRVTEHYQLNIHLNEKVERMEGGTNNFTVFTSIGKKYNSKRIIIATGFYDNPNLLNIPGENLAKVFHYYTEPHAFYKKKIVVIGGGNSAVESALELFRYNAEVTMIHRGNELDKGIKYWIRPDIENRINEGSIQMHFNSDAREIKDSTVLIENNNNEKFEIENDFVFALIGYGPDISFINDLNIDIHPNTTRLCHDEKTMETNIKGIYIVGQITQEKNGKTVFIENGRVHAKMVFDNLPIS